MFAGTSTDSDGDHWVWVGNTNLCVHNTHEKKHIWHFEYVRNFNVYRIFNDRWTGPLFSGNGVDACGDHWAW